MNAQIPRVRQHRPVLAGVKATLRVGLRPSLDPGSGQACQRPSGIRSDKIRSPRFEGIAGANGGLGLDPHEDGTTLGTAAQGPSAPTSRHAPSP
jgi:hypothetical protein